MTEVIKTSANKEGALCVAAKILHSPQVFGSKWLHRGQCLVVKAERIEIEHWVSKQLSWSVLALQYYWQNLDCSTDDIYSSSSPFACEFLCKYFCVWVFLSIFNRDKLLLYDKNSSSPTMRRLSWEIHRWWQKKPETSLLCVFSWT